MPDLKSLLKTTPKYVSLLVKNWIVTVQDFLQYFPRAYEDRSTIRNLDELIFNEKWVTATKGKVVSKTIFQRWGRKIYTIKFVDAAGMTGVISLFNSGYMAARLIEWHRYVIVGKPTLRSGKMTFSHPDIVETEAPEEEIIGDEDDKPYCLASSSASPAPLDCSPFLKGANLPTYNIGRIYPIYPELNGISPGWFAKKTWDLIVHTGQYFHEHLPEEFLKQFDLLWVVETIKNMHYPESTEMQKKAIQRIFFDRLLRVQLHALMNKAAYQANYTASGIMQQDWEVVKNIIATLPFTLTNAQKKVIKHIIDNMHDIKPMLRLLQGDVGSGKTVVAAISAYYSFKIFQWQSVFLAPLEVLANQHYRTLAKLLLPLGLRVELLTWSLTKGEKDKIKSDLKQGKVHVLVGTHAILQEDVDFQNLQFVVIDEQHKFGVRQRAFFKKFASPHILQMSATPIPRSMALAFFGEFDISIIDELPVGRKPIQTKMVSEKEYIKIKPRILEKINQGQKVFVVTPLIDESEKMEELKAATVEFEEIQALFPELNGRIGLLHGRMKSSEKDKIMQDFKDGHLNVLVSTTVIEVGVDIPEATIMIIKNSERFWLSQLHQLRGRIGRSDMQSYCFLETKNKSWESAKRLRAMEESNDGFKLAELDLQTRGAGEILGTMQSGESDIPLYILSDLKFLEKVQEGAAWLLEKYPDLKGLPGLKKYMEEKMGDVLA